MLSSSDDDTTTAKEHSEVIKTEVGRDKCNRHREKKISHKKKTNPQRRKSDMDSWAVVRTEDVCALPYDIDGKRIFKLAYDPNNQMKSSRNGRPWQTWKTLKKKVFSRCQKKS